MACHDGSVVVVVKSKNGFSPMKKDSEYCAQILGSFFSWSAKMNGIKATTKAIDLALITQRPSSLHNSSSSFGSFATFIWK
jgi:hypothetical protein